MATTSPVYGLPAAELTDAANIETAMEPLRDRLETVFTNADASLTLLSKVVHGLYTARPAASAALNGVTFVATDKAMAWTCMGGAWVFVGGWAPEVTSLPTSPVDQQECVLIADAATGTKWHVKYRAAATSASKWEVIGGTPLIAAIDTSQSLPPTDALYHDLTTVGPQIVTPVVGDYRITLAGALLSGSADSAWMSVKYSATEASDVDALRAAQISVPPGLPLYRELSAAKTIAAGVTVKARYRTGGAQTGTFANRYLQLMPRAIG